MDRSTAPPLRRRLQLTLNVRAAEGVGTKAVKVAKSAAKQLKVKILEVGDKTGQLKTFVDGEDARSIRLLNRVQELRLLSKAEKAGLLSLAESLGLTLGTIEKLGLLSKAESLGLLSAATDPKTPRNLTLLSLILLAAGPAVVYYVPEDSVPLIILQTLGAAVAVLGGSAAFGAASLIRALQRS
eukprot:SM000005S17275  [mRNA]  locus=s5:1089193:1090692:- [translate_table: standard]